MQAKVCCSRLLLDLGYLAAATKLFVFGHCLSWIWGFSMWEKLYGKPSPSVTSTSPAAAQQKVQDTIMSGTAFHCM